jgi:hypothetical protein
MLGDSQQATYCGSRREAQKLSFPPSLSVGLVDRQDIVTTAFRAANEPKQVHWMDDPSACNASERVRRARLETAIGAGGRGIGSTITAATRFGFQRCSGTPPGGLASRATFKNLRCISRAAPAWLNIGKIREGQAMLDTLVIGLLRSEDRCGERAISGVRPPTSERILCHLMSKNFRNHLIRSSKGDDAGLNVAKWRTSPTA